MRIAYFASLYPYASDTYVRNEVESLRLQGFDVSTFAIRRPPASWIVDPKIQAESDRTQYVLSGAVPHILMAVLLTVFTHPIRLVQALYLVWSTHSPGVWNRVRQITYLGEGALLARLLIRSRIEHLHNHVAENSATVAMLASHISEIPYSMTVHGPGIFYHPRAWGLSAKVQRSAFTVCITEFCRSQCMVFTEPKYWSRLVVVHCGLLDEFLLSPPDTLRDSNRLVCIGRLCAEKGHVLLLEAVRKLVAQGKDVEVTMIGDGPLRNDLEAIVAKWELSQNIRFVGWQNTEQVREYLQDARGLVLPSFAEGLPIVIMESLAMGRPVITSWITGIPELVEHGVNGWLIPAGSVDALVDAMSKALIAPVEELFAMGCRGREKVLSEHNARIEATKLAQLFRRSSLLQ